MKFRYFSGFAGIGGFDQGITQVFPDSECVGYSEVDKYAIKIYEKHFPDRTNYGDIRRIDAETLPDFDMFCGGFPCQDLSIAGKRAGLCGARSGLFFEIIRILREKQPQLVFLENVKGIFSSNNGWDFARILVELDGVGYDVEWECLNSKNFGVPQNRERVFIIGHSRREPWKPIFPIGENDKISEESIEPEGRQSQATNSSTLGVRLRASDTFIRCLTGGDHSGGAHSSMTMLCIDGNGRIDDKTTGTLTNRYNKGCESYGSNPFILQQIGVIGYDSEATRLPEGIARTIKNGGGLGAKTGLYLIGHTRDCEGMATYHEVEVAGTLKPPSGNQCNFVEQKAKIRRLTPLECERLQGYPDGWTEGISDTQRYKCLGNAVTVNVIVAIAQRIHKNKYGREAL